MAGLVPNLPPEAQRYLQALETRLEQAEKALRLLPQQKGPLPGWLRLGTIEASIINAALLQSPQPVAAGAPFVTFDFAIPLLRINDGTRDRVQIGNLASYTDPSGIISPAGYGGRVVDAAGNLIWDSSGAGAPGVMHSLGIVDVVNQSTISTAFTAVPGASINFTTTRVVNLFIPFVGTGSITTEGAGNVGQLRANLVGVTTSANANFGTSQSVTGEGWLFVNNLAAGNYTLELDFQVNQVGAGTFTLNECATQVFQIGR